MKLRIFFCLFLLVFILKNTQCQQKNVKYGTATIDYVQALKDTLLSLSDKSNNDFFRMHCNSILAVINSKYMLSLGDSTFLLNMYNAFINMGDPASAAKMSTYLQRRRPMIISWVSPTDGNVSFSWLTLPKDWDPDNKYPLYIQLHGLWSVAGNSIEYLTYPYLHSASNSTSFEDGYLLSPWGRGNFWYQGIAETDIWECMAALENVSKVDSSRKYLSGHSMGGYGAWSIASKSPDTWAALGIMAGALWYYPDLVNENIARTLKDLPTYFVCGTNDGLLEVNEEAFQLLMDAGNRNMQFITFTGGHEYLEQNVNNMYLWMRQFIKKDPATEIVEPDATTSREFWIRCEPNPVMATSNIVYSGKLNSIVNIIIYDINGRFVEEVAKGMRITGEQSIRYDASGLPEGIYFVCMQSGDRTAQTKMVVTR